MDSDRANVMKRWRSILSGTVCLSNSAVCKCEVIQNGQELPLNPLFDKFHLGAVAWSKTRVEQISRNIYPSMSVYCVVPQRLSI